MSHPKDECECGDYRYQHKNGSGKCEMPDDLTHAYRPCLQFILFKTYQTRTLEEYEKELKK